MTEDQMVVLFDYDSAIYTAVSHIADSQDIREWIDEGKSLDVSLTYSEVKKLYSYGFTKERILKRVQYLGRKKWMQEEVVQLVLNKLEQMGNLMFAAIENTGIIITSHEFYLTNDVDSVRRKIYPEYKANRRRQLDVTFPIEDQKTWTKVLNAWKAKNHKRVVNRVRKRLIDDGFGNCNTVWEADDIIADRARELDYPNFVILSMDKDMKQIPGLFFDFYRTKVFHNYCNLPRKEDVNYDKGEPKVDQYGKQEKEFRGLSVMTELESKRFFYLQVIMGDSGDNIKGIPGVGKVKANRMLDGAIDDDFESTAKLAYSEHYECQAEAMFQYELNYFLVSVGTQRDIEKVTKAHEQWQLVQKKNNPDVDSSEMDEIEIDSILLKLQT